MSIVMNCPECGTEFKFPDSLLGKTVRCKNCAHRFRVEDEEDEEEELVAAEIDDDDDEEDEDEDDNSGSDDGSPYLKGILVGAVIILLGLVICVVIATRTVPYTPLPTLTNPPAPTAPVVSDPHFKIVDELADIINRISDALDSVKDADTTRSAASVMKSSAKEIDALAARWKALPPYVRIKPLPPERAPTAAKFLSASDRHKLSMEQAKKKTRGIDPGSRAEFDSATTIVDDSLRGLLQAIKESIN